jgi:hypothetical protein
MALHLRRDRLLINEDPLSVGPARFSGDVASWGKSRQQFLAQLHTEWPDFSFDHYFDNGLLANAKRLAEPTDKVIWAADRVLECSPGAHPLHDAEISEYRAAWAAYISSDPTDLSRYLDIPARQPILQRAMRSLVLRYPDKSTGLSYCDELILKYAAEKGPRVARVVGYTIGFYEAMDSLGDLYVFDRVRRLSQHALRTPLLEFSGDRNKMRASEVRLTDFGRAVLSGKSNAIAENGIDDWIGGVHLSGNVPSAHRDGTELIIG